MSANGSQAEHWRPFVQAFVDAYGLGVRLSEDPVSPPQTEVEASPNHGPVVVLCSPHPDDEMLTGALPLRLLRQCGARVVNLALTLGSAPARQEARWQELLAACQVVGFHCRALPTPTGFVLKDGPGGRGWHEAVGNLAALLDELGPGLLFLPHREDHHPAHVMAHHLVTAALARHARPVLTAETEYWRPMAAPNLLVGLEADDLCRLLAALARHRGEIARNPYHLTFPARLLDNVRRGAELVAGPASGRPGFLFGELYRLCRWRTDGPQALAPGWLGPGDSPAALLP